MVTSGLPFVGRQLEMASLRETCADAGTAVVVGAAGLGKSRLISELCADDAFTCIVGIGATELQTSPYAVFRTLALQWDRLLDPRSLGWAEHQLNNLGPLFPALQPDSTPVDWTVDERRHGLWLSVLRYLDALVAAHPKPLVIVVEDLHAVDPSSLSLFAWLASQPVGLAIIATSRPPAPERVANLPTLGLRPLGLPSVETIQTATGATTANPQALLELTGGIPQRLHEWVLGNSLSGPVSADGALLERMLDGSSSAIIDMLQLAAVFPGTVDAPVFAQVLDVPETQINEALADAESRSVMTQNRDGSWSFQHDSYRRSLLDRLDRRRRQSYERRLVEGLRAQLNGRPEMLGHVAALSTDLGDNRLESAKLHLAAGHYASDQLASATAQRHYEAAADLSEPTGDRELILASTLALGLLLAGIADSAATSILARVYPLAESLGDGDSFARAALVEQSGLGHIGVSMFVDHVVVARLRRAATLVTDSGLKARVLTSLAVQQHSTLTETEYFELIDQAAVLAEQLGDPSLDNQILTARLGARRSTDSPGPPDDARQQIQARLDRLDPFDVNALPMVDLAVTLACRGGDLSSAERLLRRYDDEFAPLPVVAQWSVLRARTGISFARGSIEMARTLSLEALHSTTGTRLDATALEHFGPQIVAMLRERRKLADAQPTVDTWVTEYPAYTPFRACRAWLHADLGNLAAARSDLEVFFAQDLVELRNRTEGPASIAMALSAASVLIGSDAQQWCRQGYDLLAPLGSEWLLVGQTSLINGPVVRVLALASSALGEVDRALVENTEAHRVAQEAGALLFVWHALRDRGLILRRAGRIPEAIEVLEQAVERYRSAGLSQQAAWLAGEVEALAAAPAEPPEPPEAGSTPDVGRGEFRQDHRVWHVGLGNEAAICRHLKGMPMIAALLGSPGRAVAASTLAAIGDGDTVTPVRRSLAGEAQQELVDDEAVAAYRRRLDEIVVALDQADRRGNAEASATLTAEFDAIAAELGATHGLGGRRRVMSTEAERARIRVTKAIRSSIRRIGEQAPDLASHLERSIDTGVFCSYRPDPLRQVDWKLR